MLSNLGTNEVGQSKWKQQGTNQLIIVQFDPYIIEKILNSESVFICEVFVIVLIAIIYCALAMGQEYFK